MSKVSIIIIIYKYIPIAKISEKMEMNMYDVGRPERERIRHVFTLQVKASIKIR